MLGRRSAKGRRWQLPGPCHRSQVPGSGSPGLPAVVGPPVKAHHSQHPLAAVSLPGLAHLGSNPRKICLLVPAQHVGGVPGKKSGALSGSGGDSTNTRGDDS